MAKANPDNRPVTLKLTFTAYDEGSAVARLMLIGMGQIHIDADIAILDAAGNMIGVYKVAKQFAIGGLVGGTTQIEDVEKGFENSVVELVRDPSQTSAASPREKKKRSEAALADPTAAAMTVSTAILTRLFALFQPGLAEFDQKLVRPGSLSKPIVPPMAFTSALEMASPSPELPATLSPNCEKRRNNSSCWSCGMPLPKSVTVMRPAGPSGHATIAIATTTLLC